jgi:hypothetical protein
MMLVMLGEYHMQIDFIRVYRQLTEEQLEVIWEERRSFVYWLYVKWMTPVEITEAQEGQRTRRKILLHNSFHNLNIWPPK